MSNDRKRFKDLVKRARKQGWKVTTTNKGGHYRLLPSNPNARIIFLPASASDRRSWINALKECERAGLDVTGMK